MAAKTTRASRLSSINHPNHGLYIQKCCALKEKKAKIICEETAAAYALDALTAKYGARGKSAKAVFLQGIKHGTEYNPSNPIPVPPTDNGGRASETTTARPPAMVLFSRFCKRLESLIQSQTFHLGPLPSILEVSALYDEAGNLDPDLEDDQEHGLRITPQLLQEQEYHIHLRHKIYQRAMGALILQFEAYRPLLRHIKAAYDSVIHMKEHQLQELSWTAQSIQIAHQELIKKSQQISFEGIKVYKLIEDQCHLLSRHIAKQDAALQLMSGILENLETSLGDEHEQRTDSDDQNLMLIQSINEIRARLQLSPRPPTPDSVIPVAEENLEIKAEDVDDIMLPLTPNDPIILRRALDICNYDLAEETKRLEVLAEKHKNEIPRHIYLEAKQKTVDMQKEVEEFAKKTTQVQTDLEDITSLIDKCTKEKDDYKAKVEQVRGKLTPRPSWDTVGEYLEGGVPRWKSLHDGKASRVVANKLVEELHAMTLPAPIAYFTAMGEEADIPRVLRFSGQVRDRRIGRRDAEFVINDIWVERRALLSKLTDSSAQPTSTLRNDDEDDPFGDHQPSSSVRMTDFQEYVAIYFDEKFSSDQFKTEWIYNLIDACKRLSLSRKLQQFASSLFLRTEERCFHTFRKQFLSLRDILRKTTPKNNPPLDITLGDFRKLLSHSYPKKSPENLKKLVRLASKQCKAHADWTPIKFENLFMETDEGFEGRFFEEFYDQLEAERIVFAKDVLKTLLANLGTFYDLEQENDTGGETLVHIFNLSDAISQTEPTMSMNEKAAVISWVFFKVSIVPPVEDIRDLVALYLGTQNQDAMTQANVFDRLTKGIQSVFDKEVIFQGPGRKNQQVQTAPPPAPHPKEIKLRTLARRLKGAAIWRQSSVAANAGHMSSFSYAQEYAGEDAYETQELYNPYPGGTDEEEEDDAEEN